MPVSWGILGLCALALASGRGARRWRAGQGLWRPATLDPDGTVRFEDGGSATLSYGAALAPGPAVVLGPVGPGTGGPFRASAGRLPLRPDDVRPGTPTTVLAELDAARDAVWVRITATACLAMAPLAPYVLWGMWF